MLYEECVQLVTKHPTTQAARQPANSSSTSSTSHPSAMSLRRVTLTHEAVLCCATQALSTERQEVMGLLLGSWRRDPMTEQATEAEVRHVLALARTDRRKDRVEVAYEQLAAAEERASALTATTGVETRIIGWVHSHPHITVLPSHVDLRTQAQYQQMDSGFVGLIVAVFQDDAKQQLGRMELTAFQSLPPGAGGDDVIEMVADEDVVLFEGAGCEHGGLPAAFAYEASGAAGGGGGGGTYVRKGIPIRLLPASALESSNKATTVGAATATADAARCVVSLQEVLLAEERFFYEHAAWSNARNNGSGARDVHALYNAAVYAKALATLMEESGLPLLTSLEASLLNLRRDGARLAAANARMRARLQQPQEEEEGAVSMETEGAGGEGAAAAAAGEGGGANSRAAVLREVKRGVLMRVVEGADALDGELLWVGMDRDYGPNAAATARCFGVWRLRAVAAEGGEGSGSIGGQLLSIASAFHTHEPGAVCFTLAGAGPAEPRRVVMVGVDAASALWVNGVAPLVYPEVNL